MPHTTWKGTINFGLVNIPIQLVNTEDPAGGISFRQIDKRTGEKIKYKRVNAETEKEVPWAEIGKGYQYAKDIIVPVDEKELKKIAGDNAHTIAIEEFVDKKNINFLNIDRTYFILPVKKAEKGYVILREALARTKKVGIAKLILTTKEYLAAVSVYENVLVVHLLHYPDEMRQLSEFDVPSEDYKKYKVSTKEIDVAKKLIESMSGKWKPEQYKDEYKEAVQKWLDAKMKDLPKVAMKSRAHGKEGKLINFVDLLKKSLESSKDIKKSTSKKHPAHQRKNARTSRAVRH